MKWPTSLNVAPLHGARRKRVSFSRLRRLTRGRSASAYRYLTEAEQQLTPAMRRLRALAHAVRAVYRFQLQGAGREAVLAAMERMRAEYLGGMARIIEGLPFARGGVPGYQALTPSERSILQLLVKGASTKDVASMTARSPQTVDTHIRSICRKLQCNGRREAVALAVGSGWVE